ncbi:LytTR family transcriptional regulator [Sphingobacterium sp. E70]|uniref:LytTR family DNA-binding domain-containing protein n=1 Tax=Sphingobacterium sp. E70 TaxID=2853439 RepID=UPI00211C2661|nr:LytTR family DNA-binding domain-containing protein [Sphingobacterium sp. E70]ULT24175.1 LytTR family transcriptional regulator [Sphingobacterium sp. E70]
MWYRRNCTANLRRTGATIKSQSFFRANRQFIVHIDAIKRLHNHFNGKLKIEIKHSEDVEILVSREKAQLLKNWLDY